MALLTHGAAAKREQKEVKIFQNNFMGLSCAKTLGGHKKLRGIIQIV